MEKGTVKFFSHQKGFGFIKVESTGEEVFVHITGLKDDVRDNDNVVFELQAGKRGMNAVNVRVA